MEPTTKQYKTRTWTKDDFTGDDEGQLCLPSWGSEDVKIISDEITDTSRWSEHHSLIFKYEGKYYLTHYSKGLTEQQDEHPYEYDTEVECEEVEPYEKVVTAYRQIPIEYGEAS